MRTTLLVPLLVVLTVSCSSSLAPDERSKLNAARQLWEEAGIDSYRYQIDYFCFCAVVPYRAIVEVRDGEIVEVLDADTGEPPPNVLNIETIPELFGRVEYALDHEADFVAATYDQQLGYPAYIELDFVREAIDDESEVRVKDFEVLQ